MSSVPANPIDSASNPCSKFAPPAQKLGPHVAALGLAFTREGHLMGGKFASGAFVGNRIEVARSADAACTVSSASSKGIVTARIQASSGAAPMAWRACCSVTPSGCASAA